MVLAGLLLALPLASIQGLDEALAAADALAEAGDPAAARRRLTAALARAEDRGEILGRLDEIRGRLGAWAFQASIPSPGPEELLAAEVRSFKEKGLKVRLAWDWESLSPAERNQDFLHLGDRWLFRVPLTGDLKLTAEGTWTDPPQRIALLCGFDRGGESGWSFCPGFKREKIKPVLTLPRRLERIGSPFEILATATEDLVEPSGDWAWTVELRRGSFSFKKGSRKLGSWKTAYPDRTDGYAGFEGPGLRRLELSGQLDPAAWGALRDALLERRRQRFLNEEYRFEEDMPAWYGELQTASAARPPFRPPAGVPAAAAAAWAELLDPDLAQAPEEWAEDHGGLAPAALAYAGALRARAHGEWALCARLAREAREGGLEDFGPLHEIEQTALFFLGKRQPAIDALRRLLPAWPDDAGYALARLEGRVHGPRRMLEVLDEAVAAGGLSPRIADTRRTLRAALARAEEEGVTRFSGTVLHLFAEADPDFTNEAGRAAVSAIRFINRYWSRIRQPREPLVVLQFNSEESRVRFCSRAGIDQDASGYLPGLRLSLVVLDPEKTDPSAPGPLFSALWFQHLDSTLDVERIPRWFLHGFAGVLGGCTSMGAGLELRANVPLIARSAENEAGFFFTPRQLVTLPEAEWDKHAYWAECESYLLLRYLWAHAPKEQQALLQAYAEALFDGRTRAEAWQALFGRIDLEALQEELAGFRQAEIDAL